jgi:hypothetical protein
MSRCGTAGQRAWCMRRRSRPGEKGTRRKRKDDSKRLFRKAGSESRQVDGAGTKGYSEGLADNIHRLVRGTA